MNTCQSLLVFGYIFDSVIVPLRMLPLRLSGRGIVAGSFGVDALCLFWANAVVQRVARSMIISLFMPVIYTKSDTANNVIIEVTPMMRVRAVWVL